jgi:hypothetical protein
VSSQKLAGRQNVFVIFLVEIFVVKVFIGSCHIWHNRTFLDDNFTLELLRLAYFWPLRFRRSFGFFVSDNV